MPDYIRYANEAQLEPILPQLWVLEALQWKTEGRIFMETLFLTANLYFFSPFLKGKVLSTRVVAPFKWVEWGAESGTCLFLHYWFFQFFQSVSAATFRNRLKEDLPCDPRPRQGRGLTAVWRPNWPECPSAHIQWHLALWRSVKCGFDHPGQMAHSVHSVVWVSGLLMSVMWVERPMVGFGCWWNRCLSCTT